jgi:hypothetical protein
MAPGADEAYVHEHCKVLPGLPIVLDTPCLVEQADHLFARFANIKNPYVCHAAHSTHRNCSPAKHTHRVAGYGIELCCGHLRVV